ncbi:hypothetical protein EJ03DRAFT_175725 [Teratosphaeria nubilosa]|uniref:Uncharacterized protein n=1 Tax=Teratosphaeria nubilosa TaxID=161662 RepID=A0A6G1L0W0_9PEZI|nr:hypothetical protein EJ03DRAFT_175725 [Teratosphaeria nubilosa]
MRTGLQSSYGMILGLVAPTVHTSTDRQAACRRMAHQRQLASSMRRLRVIADNCTARRHCYPTGMTVHVYTELMSRLAFGAPSLNLRRRTFHVSLLYLLLITLPSPHGPNSAATIGDYPTYVPSRSYDLEPATNTAVQRQVRKSPDLTSEAELCPPKPRGAARESSMDVQEVPYAIHELSLPDASSGETDLR